MRVYSLLTGDPFDLDTANPLGSGGEARVLPVIGNASFAAKIYHSPSPARAAKLAAMRRLQLVGDADESKLDVAWPLELLVAKASDAAEKQARAVVGFLMIRAHGTRPLMDAFNPAARRQHLRGFDFRYLIHTARNLAAAVARLHANGVIVGDLNESNVLVSPTTLLTLVDTDSFQIRDADTNEIFRCRVGKLEYSPPELQPTATQETGIFGTLDRTSAHDNFALGVLIFQILMEGTHPFAGVYRGAGEPPSLPERIAAGMFPFALDGHAPGDVVPMPAAPDIAMLDREVRGLLARCFLDGHANPDARPTAGEWRDALTVAERKLQTCDANRWHKFGWHLDACPWCERRETFGRDSFDWSRPDAPTSPASDAAHKSNRWRETIDRHRQGQGKRPRTPLQKVIKGSRANSGASSPGRFERDQWRKAAEGLYLVQWGMAAVLATIIGWMIALVNWSGSVPAAADGILLFAFVGWVLQLIGMSKINTANIPIGRARGPSYYSFACGCFPPFALLAVPISIITFLMFLSRLATHFSNQQLSGFISMALLASIYFGVMVLALPQAGSTFTNLNTENRTVVSLAWIYAGYVLLMLPAISSTRNSIQNWLAKTAMQSP